MKTFTEFWLKGFAFILYVSVVFGSVVGVSYLLFKIPHFAFYAMCGIAVVMLPAILGALLDAIKNTGSFPR